MTRDGPNIEAIEERLHDHERELARTLETIREKLTSRELVGELFDRARQSGYTRGFARAMRDNPLPSVFAGICAAWLAKSVKDAIARERAPERERDRDRDRDDPTLSQVALADTAAGGRPGEERGGDERGGDAQETASSESSEASSEGRVVLPPSARPDA